MTSDTISEVSVEITAIYRLRDPEDGRVRYIGKSRNVPLRRNDHRFGRSYSNADAWEKGLRASGKEPVFEVIEECEGDGRARELFWIAHHRKRGEADLNRTGTTDRSVKTMRLSDEATSRIRICAAAAGMTQGEFTERSVIGESAEHNYCESVVQQIARWATEVSK